MSRLIPVILLLAGSCTIQAPERKKPAEPGAEIYGGKVYGIYQPLKVKQGERKIEVSGETFTYVIDKSTGQIVSAKALGTEFVATGSSFPNPYIGIMPQSDPGATKEGGADRARFSFEKAVEFRPRLFSGGLTGAERFDAINSTAVVTVLGESSPQTVKVRVRGVYSGSGKATPLSWRIDYLIDVDGFTKVTVGLSTEKPVKLRWKGIRRSTKGLPSSSGAHLGSTTQLKVEPAKLCFRVATADRVWIMSPIDPSRTARTLRSAISYRSAAVSRGECFPEITPWPAGDERVV